jgi:predicted nucleic acid-binding protein
MELLQCARDKQQHRLIKQFIADFAFTLLPLSENIGHRALVYIEEYGLSSGMRAGDAIIAATATENNMMLVSGNARHFKVIKDLELKVFKP